MASERLLTALLLLAVTALPHVAMAVEHIVGDDRGWDMEVDYKAWAEGREFFVGDKLVFNYQRGDHNVYQVDKAGFENCKAPPGVEALVTGKDVVPLTAPGDKWYICGILPHCSVANQKLEIKVQQRAVSPISPPSIAEPPSSLGNQKAVPGSFLVLAVVMVMAII